MHTLFELGENNDVYGAVEAFKAENQQDQRETLSLWAMTQWPEDDAKILTLELSSSGQWQALSSLWANPSIRKTLWLVIDDIQRHACRMGQVDSLISGLPSTLNRSEWNLSLSFAIKEKNIKLLEILTAKEAEPSGSLINHLCELYNNEPGYFYKDAIQSFTKTINWKSNFGFADYASWDDIIERGIADDNISLYVVASSLMSNADKVSLLNGKHPKEVLSKIVPHLNLDKKVLAKVSNIIKKQYLMSGLEL
jgi:hypothetical protein